MSDDSKKDVWDLQLKELESLYMFNELKYLEEVLDKVKYTEIDKDQQASKKILS